jgi:eukaryotic-like serine/threonine-protein kinase
MMNRRFQTNEKIGDYRVLEFIGRGGMGEVYHFYHEKLNRSVAVKVLGENVVADENYKARFLNEARLQASLHHPNIAALYDFQEVAGELLIFMEFVDGESLDGLIERNFFSTEETLKVFEEIVEAIRYVHAGGIVHRDIKTENVKINSGGVPKLLDFGIAKAPSSLSLTQVGGVVGTPNYLAPEQIEGREASAQTDIWSLGVLLYKMLTGRFPFDGEQMESLIFQISQARYEAPETFNPAIPKAVSGIVKKCLSKDLNYRYQTAEELLRDVRRVLNERYSGENFVADAAAKNPLPIGKISAVAGLVLLIFGLIVTGIWATGGAAEKAEVKTPFKKETVENQTRNAAPERKSESPAAQAVSEKNKRTIRIDTVGGSAEVWRGGQKIGATPLDLEVAEKEIVNLKLRRAGFEDNDVQIEASAGKKVYTFALTAK